MKVKSRGSTPKLPSILLSSRIVEENGIHGVAVKCVDIMRNTGGEGGYLEDS